MTKKLILILALLVPLQFAEAASVLPSGIQDLSLWLKADTGVSISNNLVQSWIDQSSNGIVATQSDVSKQPTVVNGSGIKFSGNQSLVTTNFLNNSFDNAFTFFIVQSVKPGAQSFSTSNGVNWQSSRDRGLIYGTESLSDIQLSLDWIKDESADFGIETFRYDGKSKLLRFNNGTGVLSKSEAASGSLGLSGALTIGSLSGGGQGIDGEISEILIYKRALTDIEIKQVENYLIQKYKIKSSRKPQIIFDGDSLTAGTGSTEGQSYPQQVIKILGGITKWAPANYAVEGQTVKHMNTDAAYQLDSPVNYDTLKPHKIVAFLGGTNDLSLGDSAEIVYQRIFEYGKNRQAAGYKVIVTTVPPRGNVEGIDFEAERQKLNNLIRKNWKSFADELSDVAKDQRIGDAGDQQNLKYFIQDNVHLTDEGYAILASSMAEAVNRIVAPKPVTTKVNTVPATSSVQIIASTSTTTVGTASSSERRFLDGFLLQYQHVVELSKTTYLRINRWIISAFGNWNPGI